MTVDVEDYFHVSAFESVINQEDWKTLPLRVERNTYRLLEIFEAHNTKATFFTLGWVAEKCPTLIRAIVEQGHELASHGSSHKRLTLLSKEEVYQDIKDSKHTLEDISGSKIAGYRAPSFSVNDSNTWVYEMLVDLGFKYSSSTYPVEHDLYGVPKWPRFTHMRKEGIAEIPVPTIRKSEKNIGIGGGGYFRLYPYWFSKRRIEHFLSAEQVPYSFYFHPWEIDPEQPKMSNVSFKSKFRHYINLASMEGKIVQLLKDYNWSTMKDVYLDKNSNFTNT